MPLTRASGAVIYVVLSRQVAGLDEFKFHVVREIDPIFRYFEIDDHLSLSFGEDVQYIVTGSAGSNLAKVMAHILEEIGLESLGERSHVIEQPEFPDFLGESESVVSGVGFGHKRFVFCSHKRRKSTLILTKLSDILHDEKISRKNVRFFSSYRHLCKKGMTMCYG